MNSSEPVFEERWDTIRGLRMYSRVCAGNPNAPALVLVHGLSMSSLYWLPTAKRLAADYRVYIPDLPGYGTSQKPDDSLDIPTLAAILAEWIERMQVGPAVMVGNSLGCHFIAALNDQRPDCVTHAVLVGPWPDPSARTYASVIRRALIQPWFEPPVFWAVMLMDYLAHGFKRTFQTMDHAFDDPFEERLTRLAVPTLVVRGQHDRITSQQWVEAASRMLPHGHLVTVPGGGHVVNYDAPDQLARVIRGFLRIVG